MMLTSKPRGWLKLGIFTATLALGVCHLEVVYEWNYFTYNFPPNYPINDETYSPGNIFPTGIEIVKDRIFVATPSIFPSTPVTLSWIPWGVNYTERSPALQPYPNWEVHRHDNEEINCDKIISVYKIRADSNNMLWVLDSGVRRRSMGFNAYCPPKMLVYDLATDILIKIVTFPREVLGVGASLFKFFEIEEIENCVSYIYIADASGYGLIVYNVVNELMWRMEDQTMIADPRHATATIAGEKITLTEGIEGLALSLPDDCGESVLYYQSFTSNNIYSVNTKYLKAGLQIQLPVKIVAVKPSQGTGLAVNPIDGALYASPVEQSSILSWQKDTNIAEVIISDTELLQLATELRFPPQNDGLLWILSTRVQKFGKCKTINFEEIHFRIMRLQHCTGHGLDVGINIIA